MSTLDITGYAHTKWYYQLVENFCVYLQAKNQLHPPLFSGDIAKICKLLIFGTLGIPGYTNPTWQYQLVEDFDVYLNAKNKLIIHFFQFDWVTAFLSITQVADFSQIWDWCWISTTILTFISNYFQEKLITNHTHVKKVGHTTKFLFGICWWTWKTTFY